MTDAQVKRAAILTVQLYKLTNEREIYQKYLMTSTMMEDGQIDPMDAADLIDEDRAYLKWSNDQIGPIRSELITLTRGRSREEEYAMWVEERRLISTSIEKLKELNHDIDK